MSERYDRLTRADLHARLRAERDALREASVPEAERVAREVSVYQLELEIKSRDLDYASRQVQQARETLAAASSPVTTANLQVDHFGSVLLAEGATTELFGVAPDKLAGQSLADLVQDADRWKLDRHLKLIRAGEQKSAIELRLRHVDGRQVRAILDSRRFSGPEENPRSCDIRLVDITQQRQAEAEARRHISAISRAARFNALGEMASGIAHELSQPLSAIVAYARAGQHLLQSGSPLAEAELQQSLEKVAQQAERAGEIIRRIRGFVRKDAPRTQQHSIAELLQHALTVVDDDIQEANIAVHVEGAEDETLVYVDAVAIEQVLVNLLRNAIESVIDARTEAREISIRIEQAKRGWIKVSLIDNGKGFRSDDLEQWFMPFATGRRGSMGLGLSLSRSLVEAHGGHLWAEPVTDVGARLCFTIPTEPLE